MCAEPGVFEYNHSAARRNEQRGGRAFANNDEMIFFFLAAVRLFLGAAVLNNESVISFVHASHLPLSDARLRGSVSVAWH